MFLHLSVILFRGVLCPSMHHRSHDQGGLCLGVSVQKDLCLGSICPQGSLSRGLCSGGDLCPGGSLSGGSLSRVYLSTEVSVQGGLCPEGISVRETAHQRPPYSNEKAVCILLGCILL